MRRCLLICLAALLPSDTLAQVRAIRWPEATIPVPPLVQSFILSECREFAGLEFHGADVEDMASCVNAEEYGYRAVVTMLMDESTGDVAAGHYRNCRVGLGTQGGRFYRRRAKCMGRQLSIIWRFEFTRRASLAAPPAATDFAADLPKAARTAF